MTSSKCWICFTLPSPSSFLHHFLHHSFLFLAPCHVLLNSCTFFHSGSLRHLYGAGSSSPHPALHLPFIIFFVFRHFLASCCLPLNSCTFFHFQVLRDIFFMVPDLLHLTLPFLELRKVARSRNVPTTHIISNKEFFSSVAFVLSGWFVCLTL